MNSNCKTLKNKLFAVVILAIGYCSMFIDGDATGLVLALGMSGALFFAKENIFD